jgi:hypothetical protein
LHSTYIRPGGEGGERLTHNEGIGDELRRHRCVHRPANHPAREEIDDGGYIEPAFACVRGHAVFEFSDDIVELNGVGYWLKTGLGLRPDIAPLSAIAPPSVERDCVTGTASTASQRPCRDGKLFTVPPLEPKSHRIIVC